MVLTIQDIPTFEYTEEIAILCKDIEGMLRRMDHVTDRRVRIKLRKVSKIKSIYSSLLIESSNLTLETMQDIINGKFVEGPFDEILEAKNAITAYEMIKDVDIHSTQDFLKVENTLMWGLVPENGYRDSKVGVRNGEVWDYIAPSAEYVSPMMERLFSWSSKSGYPGYLVGAIVHFYIESIHPLRDGNGRIGRLWYNESMVRYSKTFQMISIENLIREHQEEYYDTLKKCQSDMDCTDFCIFCLHLVRNSLEKLTSLKNQPIQKLLGVMSEEFMSAPEIMKILGISNRSYFLKNYLRPAVESGLVEMFDPEHPKSSLQKYRSLLFRD